MEIARVRTKAIVARTARPETVRPWEAILRSCSYTVNRSAVAYFKGVKRSPALVRARDLRGVD